ncbi:hypothetical protein KA012_00190 [Candidatus Woesebacteria bacterium]|nr:hypothetical protein [Candidatus Woesebacteria bacterium]
MLKQYKSTTSRTVLSVLLLTVATALTRIWPAVYRLVPFGFDHGKDSIAVLSMLVTHTPKLIGPWTSIPGVFFGPGWYYLLLPGFAISGGDPVSAAWIMIVISLVQSLLVWRVWGLRGALVVSLMPMYIITSTSAWNPYPMTLISFVLLAVTWQLAETKKLSDGRSLLFGLIAGLGFHFSAAFSIFYLPLVLCVPFFFKLKQKIRTTAAIIAGLILSFLPQLLFELRHSFVETKALLQYFSQGEPHTLSITKIMTVIQTVAGEISLGVFPGMNGNAPFFRIANVLTAVFVFLFSAYFFRLWWKKSTQWQRRWLLYVLFFLIPVPIIGYFFLHFNVWYVYGMAPIATLLIVLALKKAPTWAAALFLSVFMITSGWNLLQYFTIELPEHQQSKTMLASKEKVLDFIVQDASGQPFAMYTFVPDIYDYSYQYLWFRRAFQGGELPVDFSYRSGTTDYITDKGALLQHFTQQKGTPAYVYFVIEQPNEGRVFDDWWSMQSYGEVVGQYAIGKDILVIKAEAPIQQ